MQRLAVFRADASPSIGSGHARRCLVLRDQLSRAGWATAFAGTPETLHTVPAIRSDNTFMAVSGSGETVAASLREAWPRGVDLMVVDSYELDSTFESACRPWARGVLVIDDLADRTHDCDILLDANYGRRRSDYAGLVPASSRLLIGLRYCLLRPEFRASRARSLSRRSRSRRVARVFVSFGGVDPKNTTSLVLKAFAGVGFRGRVDIALGSAAPHLLDVKRLVSKLPYATHLHVDCDRVAAVMAGCDLGVGAGGTMTWERACLGLPSVIIPIAENQLPAAQSLARDGRAFVTAPLWKLTERELAAALRNALNAHAFRRQLQARTASCVDGAGVWRVAKEAAQMARPSDPLGLPTVAGAGGSRP